MRNAYLVEIEQREQEACRRLVQMPFLSERMFARLGMQAWFSWFILDLQKDRLVSGLRGDIDVLAGRLSWTDPAVFEQLMVEERTAARGGRHDSWNYQLAATKLARAGGIAWPPSASYLVGLEAKCAYLEPSAGRISRDALRSTKPSAKKVVKVRRQIESLLEMGLEEVALLDIIANPPVSGPDGGAWISSLAVAVESAAAMGSISDKRLPEECDAGHWVWSSGAVVGGYEFQRGAGCPQELRPSKGNGRLKSSSVVGGMRQEVEKNLGIVLAQFATPLVFPAVFLDCRDCGTVHALPWDGAGCKVA